MLDYDFFTLNSMSLSIPYESYTFPYPIYNRVYILIEKKHNYHDQLPSLLSCSQD